MGKAGDLVLADGIVKLPIVGTGSIAGFGKIDKTFTDPSTFAPLTWSREDDTSFVALKWCSLRAKNTSGSTPDGDEFDDYLADDTTYPSLAGVSYPSEPNLACKVYEAETLEGVYPNTLGVQTTVVYFEDDPYFG